MEERDVPDLDKPQRSHEELRSRMEILIREMYGEKSRKKDDAKSFKDMIDDAESRIADTLKCLNSPEIDTERRTDFLKELEHATRELSGIKEQRKGVMKLHADTIADYDAEIRGIVQQLNEMKSK